MDAYSVRIDATIGNVASLGVLQDSQRGRVGSHSGCA